MVFFYAYMATYNFYCFDCGQTYTQEVETTESKDTPWGTFDCVTCKWCGGLAKVVGTPTAPLISAPPWAIYEQAIHTGTADEQRVAGDKFIEERKRWTSAGKWGNWEKGRKEEWQKNKVAWKKQQKT